MKLCSNNHRVTWRRELFEFALITVDLSVFLGIIRLDQFFSQCLWCLPIAEKIGDDDNELGKGDSDPFSCISGSIAWVVSFTIRLMNFANGRTNREAVSARQKKASMNVEDCAQRFKLQSNILFSPPVAAISVNVCITKRYVEVLCPSFTALLRTKKASNSAFSMVWNRSGSTWLACMRLELSGAIRRIKLQTCGKARRFDLKRSLASAETRCSARSYEGFSLSDTYGASNIAIGSCTACPAWLYAVRNEGWLVRRKMMFGALAMGANALFNM